MILKMRIAPRGGRGACSCDASVACAFECAAATQASPLHFLEEDVCAHGGGAFGVGDGLEEGELLAAEFGDVDAAGGFVLDQIERVLELGEAGDAAEGFGDAPAVVRGEDEDVLAAAETG